MTSEPERQIRSYHKAFQGDLTIYSFGRDLRPWRPIPARGIFWVGGLVFVMFVLLRALSVRLVLFSLPWAFFYLGIPLGLGWLMTVARVEGRRVHVVAGAWARYALRGRESVGGYRRLTTPASARQGGVRIAHAYTPPRRSRARYIVWAFPLAALGIVLLIVLDNRAQRRITRDAPVPAASAVVRTSTLPVLPAVSVKRAGSVPHRRPTRRPTIVRTQRRSIARPSRTRSAAPIRIRAIRPSTPRRAIVLPPSPPPSPRIPIVARAPVVRPVTPSRVSVAPRPTCYPGTLGC